MPKRAAPTFSASPADVGVEAAHDRVAEVFDREELVAVRAVAEDRDPPSFADPVEQDLEDAEPFGPDERLRAHDHDLEAPPGEGARRRSASIFDSP